MLSRSGWLAVFPSQMLRRIAGLHLWLCNTLKAGVAILWASSSHADAFVHGAAGLQEGAEQLQQGADDLADQAADVAQDFEQNLEAAADSAAEKAADFASQAQATAQELADSASSFVSDLESMLPTSDFVFHKEGAFMS